MREWIRLFVYVVEIPFLVLGFVSSSFAQPAAYTNVTTGSGLATAGRKDGGLSWGDFNNDGCLDVLVNSSQNGTDSQLYLQDIGPSCSGTFSNVTTCLAPGLEASTLERSAIWGDINNDGFIDFARDTARSLEIYLNNGSGSTPCGAGTVSWTPFGTGGNPSQVINSTPIGFNSEGLGWMDYDADGDLDLACVNHESLVIFDNDGSGTLNYLDPTTMGLPGDRSASAGDYGAVTDLDADGDVDWVTRMDDIVDLYLNNGNGTFSANVLDEMSQNNNKGGVAFCDFDSDGDFDLFWTDQGTNQIWEQSGLGSGAYVARGVPSGITDNIDGVACQDIDNDGDIDLMLTSDVNDLLFRNDGGFAFTDVTPAGFGAMDGEGSAFGDYDRDGDLDLLINQDTANELWRNDTDDTNYLMVQALHYDSIQATTRDAIGATVTLRDCQGNLVAAAREVNGGRGHGSQDPAMVHFGLPTIGTPAGSSGEYIVRVKFVGGAVVGKAVVPSTLGAYQVLTILSTDSNDTTACTTEVELSSFTATGRDGEVELEWQTASELNNLGFHLHRSRTATGTFERITAIPIPGLGSSPSGALYSYRDVGLENGRTYFYTLEDIDTRGKTEFHGPIQATPTAGTTDSAPILDERGPSASIVYGEPSANRLLPSRRGHGQLVLELRTEGFTAVAQDDGTVRIEIQDFEIPAVEKGPALPVRRTWIEAEDGKRVKLQSVRSVEVESFCSLSPTSAHHYEAMASQEGIVRPRLRRDVSRSRVSDGIYPEEEARILELGFQGDVQKAYIELAPFRWDGTTGCLQVARRLVVKLSFLKAESKGRRARGRFPRRNSKWRRGGKGRHVVARFSTVERGLYGVRYEDVFGEHKNVRLPEAIRLSRQNLEAPYHLKPGNRGFGPGSTLFFFSEGADANRYGHEAVYEFEIGIAGRVMEVEEVRPSGTHVPYYWTSLVQEENRLYQAGLLNVSDIWFWDLLFAPATKTYPFKVSRLATIDEESRLVVRLQGGSNFPPSPDHHIRVFVNGAFVHEVSWNGKSPRDVEVALPANVLQEGENLLTLENVGDTEAAHSMVMLDRFEVDYPRFVEADNGKLEGRFDRSGTVSVRGFESKPYLLDTSEAPRWLTGLEQSDEGIWNLRVDSGRRYFAADADGLLCPKVEKAGVARLRDERLQADYIVIGPRSFLEAAEPLITHRRHRGLRVMAVGIGQIYDEFGFGESSPEAVRRFLTYAYHYWRTPHPRYVLLLGDATYDFKDYLKTGVVNQVPSYPLKTTFLWTVSDPAYAFVNGDDALPDMAVGRLPASSVESLRDMVTKIVNYETGDSTPDARVVLIADNADRAGNFRVDAEKLANGILSGRNIQKIYLDDMDRGSASVAIIDAFDQGAFLLSYLGHGGIGLWASENIFNTGQAELLSPQSHQPFVFTMNCLNGYFHFPYFDSLGEKLLESADKGAIAAFSPSGLSLNRPAHIYQQAILKEILEGEHARLGDAVHAAQGRYAEAGVFPELLAIFHLFGDPALELSARD